MLIFIWINDRNDSHEISFSHVPLNIIKGMCRRRTQEKISLIFIQILLQINVNKNFHALYSNHDLIF